MWESEMGNSWPHIPIPAANGTEDCYSLPGQDFLCLPGCWLCSSHMASDEGRVYLSPAGVPLPDPGILYPCLTLFLLKTMEGMVDRYLREEALAFMPLLLGWEIHGNSLSSAHGVG